MEPEGRAMEPYESELSRARMIALAQTTIVVALGVVLLAMDMKIVWPLPDAGILRIAFLVLSVGAFAAVPLLQAVFLSRLQGRGSRVLGDPGREEGPASATGQGDGSTLLTLSIAQMAVFEVPLLLGFVLSVNTEALTDYVLFMPIALVGWIQVFPRRARWNEWLEAPGPF